MRLRLTESPVHARDLSGSGSWRCGTRSFALCRKHRARLETVNGGSVTAGQQNFGHDIYPVNDHPADKASYDIHFDVPEGTTAVANGDLVSRTTTNGRTSSVYVMDEPMASELIQLAVGQFDITDGPAVDGVNVRDVLSSSATGLVAPAL